MRQAVAVASLMLMVLPTPISHRTSHAQTWRKRTTASGSIESQLIILRHVSGVIAACHLNVPHDFSFTDVVSYNLNQRLVRGGKARASPIFLFRVRYTCITTVPFHALTFYRC